MYNPDLRVGELIRVQCRLAAIVASVALVLIAVVTAPAAAQSRAPARRGAPGATSGPLTTVSISVGEASYKGVVDANCHVDERATPNNTRAYYVAMYPWFGQRPPASQPQWRFNLEIRRNTTNGRHDQFAFSFLDREKAGHIQTVAGAERMGSGTVSVTRKGAGARFVVTGRSKEGEPVRATIDCSAFQHSEAGGG